MTPDEVYQRVLIQLQANGTTDAIKTSKDRVAVTYNKVQNQLLELFIERKKDDDLRYIQEVSILGQKLKRDKSESNRDIFALPKDFFDFIDLEATASNESCSKQRIHLDEIKGQNKSSLLTDTFTKPSFKFRESLYQISQNSVHIYKEGFSIDTLELDYYKYPTQIELENPSNPESVFILKQLQFDDKLINKIITLTSSALMLNGDDPKYQALKQEIINKI